MAKSTRLRVGDIQNLKSLMARLGDEAAVIPGRSWETMNTMSIAVETATHGLALLKLYRHENKYRREVHALGLLSLSEYAPDLYQHGQLARPLRIHHQRSDTEWDCLHYILRQWFEGLPGKPPPRTESEDFLKCVFAYCDHCALHGLRIGDMKDDAFVWHGGRLTWIDYDGYNVDDTYRERLALDNRDYVRGRLERLGVV